MSNGSKSLLPFAARWMGYAVIVLIVLIIATGGFFTVGQNERTVLTTWGALSGIYGPGLHFKIPMVQATHSYEINQKTISNYAPQHEEHGLSTYTVDNQEVFGWLTVFYTLKPSELEYIYTNISRDPDELATRIWSVAVNTYKIELGKVNTNEVAQKRGEIIKSVKAEVTGAVLAQLHLQIDDVQIPEIVYSSAFNQGVEAAALAKVRIEQALQERIHRLAGEAQSRHQVGAGLGRVAVVVPVENDHGLTMGEFDVGSRAHGAFPFSNEANFPVSGSCTFSI